MLCGLPHGFHCCLLCPLPQVDILHPLATLTWTKCAATGPENVLHGQCVYLNGRLYITSKLYNHHHLYVINSDFTGWREWLSVPVTAFALTHYHSQLVLVGGREPGTDNPSNKLWMSADGTDWQPSLPPMRMKCAGAVAVNTGSPECLVVVARHGVEVFVNDEWLTATPLPSPRSPYSAHIHNGNLIVNYYNYYWSCRVQSLILPQQETERTAPTLWRECKHNFFLECFFCFGQQLVSAGERMIVLDPSTGKWVQLADPPCYVVAGTILPTGELVVVDSYSVYKASLKCKCVRSCWLDTPPFSSSSYQSPQL